MGCQEAVCRDTWFATEVLESRFGPGQSFGRASMPDVVLGPPRGGGCCKGSLDVVSLGNGGTITLGFERTIVDGPGPDFVVFENPFEFGAQVYAELATVEASADGVDWRAYPCSAVEPPFGACAGWRPVHLDGVDGPVSPETSGGDAFDLADVGLATARFVRITDRVDVKPPDGGSFELDAVGIVHGTACDSDP
jgi:hypothetical protein